MTALSAYAALESTYFGQPTLRVHMPDGTPCFIVRPPNLEQRNYRTEAETEGATHSPPNDVEIMAQIEKCLGVPGSRTRMSLDAVMWEIRENREVPLGSSPNDVAKQRLGNYVAEITASSHNAGGAELVFSRLYDSVSALFYGDEGKTRAMMAVAINACMPPQEARRVAIGAVL